MEKATITQKTKIVLMLGNSCFTPGERKWLKSMLSYFSTLEATQVIAGLIIVINQRTTIEVDLSYFDYDVRITYKKLCRNTSSPIGRLKQPGHSASNAA